MKVLKIHCDDYKKDTLKVFHSKDKMFGDSINMYITNLRSDGRYTENVVVIELDKIKSLHKFLGEIISSGKSE